MVQVGDSGISSYSFNPDNSLAFISSANDTKDTVTASCWISSAGDYYFVSNAGSGNVSIYRLDPSGMASLIRAMPTTAAAGTTDSVTTPDGHFLYVECGGARGARLPHPGDGSLSLIQTVTGCRSRSRGSPSTETDELWRPARPGRHSGAVPLAGTKPRPPRPRL